MKSKIKKCLPNNLLECIRIKAFNSYVTKSYSQEGEDMILRRIFENKKSGFYVDVGAHHPVRFSNTYMFYKLGWSGINIEPNPESMKLFEIFRKRDINLNIGISEKSSNLNYYMFNEPALNTFDVGVAKQHENNDNYKIEKIIEVQTRSLTDVLDEYSSIFHEIDIMTVDVEGFDLEVLKSNDWIKYRPKWILVEQLSLKDLSIVNFEINNFLVSKSYVLFAKTFNTLFYKNEF